MNKAFLIVGAIALFALTTAVKPGDGGGGDAPPLRWQYTGTTAATFDGAAGALARTAACEAEYGPGARWCASSEIVESTEAPAIDAIAWVRPSDIRSLGGSSYVYDAVAGFQVSPSGYLNCNGWDPASTGSSSGAEALTVTTGGGFGHERCNIALPVACCTYR